MNNFNPNLINLIDYEKSLYKQKENGIVLRPPPTIPSKFPDGWTNDEMKSMRKNRDVAQKIYDKARRF